MPYTPPSSSRPPQRLGTTPATRNAAAGSTHGRRSSESSLSGPAQPTKPAMASSSSYIRRHRRSPSSSISRTDPPPELRAQYGGKNQDDGRVAINSNYWHTSTARCSSPSHPGAVPSPPDSKNNSSDEHERQEMGQRAKERLTELTNAILTMNGESRRASDATEPTRNPQHIQPMDALAANLDVTLGFMPRKPRDSLSKASDSLLLGGAASDIATQTPDQSSEDELFKKPPMIRKKSGELVRPALRLSAAKRPKSMPGTPTFAKAVHFGAQLEEVRHFLQLDRPAAVSAATSPVEEYDADSEFPFNPEDAPSPGRSFQWEAQILNAQSNSRPRGPTPVRLDHIFMSADNRYLVGVIVVANLAFSKHVVARFTLDYWKTVSEVTAEYSNDIQLKEEAQAGYDTFNFKISLADHLNLEDKRMFICIRYNVGGMEFWDNNNSMNYHIDFTKRYTFRNEKLETPANTDESEGRANPRRRRGSLVHQRSHSVPSIPADHLSAAIAAMPEIQQTLGPPLTSEFSPPSPTRRSGQVFGSRYNFGTSLNATGQAGPSSLSATRDRRPVFHRESGVPVTGGRDTAETAGKPVDSRKSVSAHPDSRTSPTPAEFLSGKFDHQSAGYQELVNKYCFYGSSQQVPPPRTRAFRHSYSGRADEGPEVSSPPLSDSSVTSSASCSPPPQQNTKESSYFGPHIASSNHLETRNRRSPSPAVFDYFSSGQSDFLSNSPTPTAIQG